MGVKRERVSFRIHKALFEQIQEIAERGETTPSNIAKTALVAAIKQEMEKLNTNADGYAYYPSINFGNYKLIRGKKGIQAVFICVMLTKGEEEIIRTIFSYSYDIKELSNLRSSLIFDYLQKS